MDLASIVHQIDAEISKLQRIRDIVQGLAGSGRRPRSQKARRSKPIAIVPRPTAAAPELVILPPKQKREYQARLKPIPAVSRALAPAPSDRPVFVPRASVPSRVELDRGPAKVHSLEAVVRQNLLGGVA
jgi:hypothetical protein